MLKGEWLRKATGSYRTYPSLVKRAVEVLPLSRTAALILEFAVNRVTRRPTFSDMSYNYALCQGVQEKNQNVLH